MSTPDFPCEIPPLPVEFLCSVSPLFTAFPGTVPLHGECKKLRRVPPIFRFGAGWSREKPFESQLEHRLTRLGPMGKANVEHFRTAPAFPSKKSDHASEETHDSWLKKILRPANLLGTSTTPHPSKFSAASKPSASAQRCTSVPLASWACTISSGKWWTIPWTKPWPAIATKSTSRFTTTIDE